MLKNRRTAGVLCSLMAAMALTHPTAAQQETPPISLDDAWETPQDDNLSVDAPGVLDNDQDPDGDPLTAVLISSSMADGLLFLEPDGSLEYEPAPGFLGVDEFTYAAFDGTSLGNVATIRFTITLPTGGGAQLFTDEALFLANLEALGYLPVDEGFEDDAVWGVARTPVTVPSITSQGITWTGNNGTSQITTGSGAAQTGGWGFYELPHGNQTSAPACGIPGACTDGWRGSTAAPLVAIGGKVRNNVGIGKMSITLDDDPARSYESPQPLVISTIFIGVIDPAGFTSFEFRELEGKNEDQVYIFGDDMLFAWAAPDPWTDLSGGTSGAVGSPTLSGSGPLTAGSMVGLTLVDGPSAAPVLAWLSFAPMPQPALGGTLHAFPFAQQFLFTTDAAGVAAVSVSWPPGIPAATSFWTQYLMEDTTVPWGLVLSNGLLGVTP